MEAKDSETPTVEVISSEETIAADDDIDISDIAQADAILEKSALSSVKMLEFEKQMFMDCVYSDGLVICGK